MKLAKGIACAALLLSGAAAQAEEFEYRIYSIASNASDTDCFSEITAIGGIFAARAGVDVTSANCIVNRFDDLRLDGVITYTADSKVEIKQLLKYGNIGTEETALYSSEEACLEAIPAQRILFEQQTGLTSHVAYCEPNGHQFDERWSLQIEAAGTSNVSHYFMGSDLFGNPAQGFEALWEELSAELTGRGLTISNAALISRMVYYRLTIAYYHTSRKHLHQNDAIRLESGEACEQILPRAKAAFATMNNPALVVYCDQDRNGTWGPRLNIITLEDSITDTSGYRYQVMPGFYEDFVTCQADREHQIERAEAAGQQVIEAICGVDSQRRIVLHGFVSRN